MCFGSKKHVSQGEQAPSPVRLEASQQGYSRMVHWDAYLGLCSGCGDDLSSLLEDLKARHHRPHHDVQRLKIFHNSFNELEECASRCKGCRIFRQAFLLRQPSLTDEISLRSEVNQKPISATILPTQWPDDNTSPTSWTIKVSIGNSSEYSKCAYVAVARSTKIDYLQLEQNTANLHTKVLKWLDKCKDGHHCKKLNWSTTGPSRLIKILDRSTVQLVNWPQDTHRPDYMILSYCWGGDEGGKTMQSNLPMRLKPFRTSSLPATLSDAIEIAHSVQIEYVWIDQVCIIQDMTIDWERESQRMHEYYGNAVFTLCAGSNTRARQHLLRDRQAWKWKQLPCELKGYKLFNIDTPLTQAQSSSPLSSRGWTLQEEYLSPRKLYWFNQTMYWSCAEEVYAEDIDEGIRRPPQPRTSQEAAHSHIGGSFLSSCWKDEDREELHKQWLEVVESYTRRNLSFAKDRFTAISGVASRYSGVTRDRYLAGLWASSLGQDLLWASCNASDHASSIEHVPSWSWASLPLGMNVEFQDSFRSSSEFQFLGADAAVDPSQQTQSAEERVQAGSICQSILVRGRLKLFWSKDSQPLPWSAISKDGGGKQRISFEISRNEDAHSADPISGSIVVYRAHTQEIFGQLDYVQDARRVQNGDIEVFCLEVGRTSVLLLERSGGNKYRRVGICHTARKLCEGAGVEQITLI